MTPLAEQVIQISALAPVPDEAGRRLRVFARLVRCTPQESPLPFQLLCGMHPVAELGGRPTYGEAIAAVAANAAWAEPFSRLPLRVGGTTAARLDTLNELREQQATQPSWMNPALPDALQDLAEEIAIDLHEACVAFEQPDLWYPGVDEGIAPVTDDHVRLVIAALQRELNRETRYPDGSGFNFGGGAKLPAAPLARLPWRVQRALVERRRLRFAQYGIGPAEWDAGQWSLWNVAEDPDWLPRTVTDGRTAFGVVG